MKRRPTPRAGPWWERVLILFLRVAAVLRALVVYGFPWVIQFVNPQEVTVQ